MTFKIDLSTALWIYWSTVFSMTVGLVLLRAHRIWRGSHYWALGNVITLCNLAILLLLYSYGATSSSGILPGALLIIDGLLKVASLSNRLELRRQSIISILILALYFIVSCTLLIFQQGPSITGTAGTVMGLLSFWQGWILLRSKKLANLPGSNLFAAVTFILGSFLLSTGISSMLISDQQALFERSEQVGFGVLVLVNLMILRHLCLIAMLMAMLNRRLAAGRIRNRNQISLRRQAEVYATSMANLAEEKQSLLEVLTHEVRQPLNNAQAALQDFLTRRSDDIRESRPVERLQAILDQIVLTLSNAIVGANLLERRNASALVSADIVAVSELACSDAGINWQNLVQFSHPDHPVLAAADPILLRLALRNLIDNGLRHSAPGHKISVKITAAERTSSVEIAVANCPLEPFDINDQLFERGVRGENAIGHGQGLGLYIVREIAQLHHGTISARTTADLRTEFTLAIPLAS